MKKQLRIPVELYTRERIYLIVGEEKENTLFEIDRLTAYENGESPWQLKEGCTYEYILPEGYIFESTSIIYPSVIQPNRGRIRTNIYVGSLTIPVWKENKKVGNCTLEIQSAKTDYRTDYRIMLEEITTKSVDLLMQQSALVNQHFTFDPTCDSQTLYQRFSFIRSLIQADEFTDALYRIQRSPVKRWKEVEILRDSNRLKRIHNGMIRQMLTHSQRMPLPEKHPLKSRMYAIPQKTKMPYKEETVDIPENQFIKYVLETFLQFCIRISLHACAGERLKKEALQVTEQLEQFLSVSLFREVGTLMELPLNNLILQRKEGYREILQSWCMFDMAARLVWSGGDHIYEAGKRDGATLYEYWLFFKLLSLVEETFHLPSTAVTHLIEPVKKGQATIELKLKQGEMLVIAGVYRNEVRNLAVEFNYNKTFSTSTGYPDPGSWTKQMRPDYTLTIWPDEFTRRQAEEQELLIHIHFDAKYKIDIEEKRGNYIRADLLKMHAYKDSIHHTVGAYILYPGNYNEIYTTYNEILPGIGAFAIAPGKADNTVRLKHFLQQVIQHVQDRASQREKITYHKQSILTSGSYEVGEESMKYRPFGAPVIDPDNREILIGYCKSEKHKKWILKNRLYNIRTGKASGALPLNEQTVGVKYLLLQSDNDPDQLFRLSEKGPTIYSREELLDRGYPSSPGTSFYIVYELRE